MRENHVKTISLGEGLRYNLSCTPRAFLMHANLFSGMGYVKIHGFHGNPLHDSRDCGVGYTFNHI